MGPRSGTADYDAPGEHGGRIRVESEPGQGSRFHFTLPLRPRQMDRDEPASAAGLSARETPLILVADDERASQELLTSYLDEAGYQTITAGTGAEAIRKARDLHPDLITLDMLMPGKSGWETLYELKQTPVTANIPVMVVSVVDERKMAMAMGASDYLVKPVPRDALLAATRRLTHVHEESTRG